MTKSSKDIFDEVVNFIIKENEDFDKIIELIDKRLKEIQEQKLKKEDSLRCRKAW